ncbi:hypothetical protein C8Q69DRAFT_467153 [Paecilomyces variotii]|uniref:Secreted protein n=1 Tax=Byssochlamys spectabilis TaxID=264951 RepID=A0A443HVG5_BYSSP|nr:hypothetical protein C8Q69DRAFT_467153 [Paecilomyces variotii]RWQ95724.1 hypothetical protein C8Q69DRAFT_467153 [Paecilomyces variotii]
MRPASLAIFSFLSLAGCVDSLIFSISPCRQDRWTKQSPTGPPHDSSTVHLHLEVAACQLRKRTSLALQNYLNQRPFKLMLPRFCRHRACALPIASKHRRAFSSNLVFPGSPLLFAASPCHKARGPSC